MDFLSALWAWFTDPLQWSASTGIPVRAWEHVQYSGIATLIGALIALPVGLGLGHLGKGGLLAINIANMGRAIPSFGVIILVFILAGLSIAPVIVALVALAVPPIVTNSYVGVRSVGRDVRDAAEGMAMTGWQILRRVELPVAMPLVMAGIRTSAVQVVATATLAAYIGFGGLGRFLFDGLSVGDIAQVTGGAILVAVLSLVTELLLGRIQSLVVSEGLAPRNRTAAVSAKLGAGAR